MTLDTSKRIHEIYCQVLHDPKFHHVATAFRAALDELQRKAQTFSEEQWSALNRYLSEGTVFMETMMEIALDAVEDDSEIANSPNI